MPQLPNPRHERFCALVADGESATAAYEQAGYRRNDGNAGALRHREDVSARISELLAERATQNAQATAKAIEELALTKEWVLAELKQNAAAAAKLKQYGPSNRALELLGKELGMFIDRSKIETTQVREPNFDVLSEAERAIVGELFDQLKPYIARVWEDEGKAVN